LIICSDGMWQNWNISALVNTPEDRLIKVLSEQESANDDNYSMIRIHLIP